MVDRWWVLALVLAASACGDTVIDVGLPGDGPSTVLMLREGAVALARDTASAPLPAISGADLEDQVVLALDYRSSLSQLHIAAGDLAEDPAGEVLPAADAVYRLRADASGDGATWAPVELDAADRARRFRGVAPLPTCPVLSQRAAMTGTVTLAGDPRFLINAGPSHVWIGLAGQPVRALEVETGRWTRVALDDADDVLLAARGEYGYDSIATVRLRSGAPVFESWVVDQGRLGQVERTPRASVSLPPADYRWVVSPVFQDQILMYALASEGRWIRYDDRGGGLVELARWDARHSGAIRGAVAVNLAQDAVVVLSDSATVRWVTRGGREVRSAVLGAAPLVHVDVAKLKEDDFVVTAADGALFWLPPRADAWVPLGRTSGGEALTALNFYAPEQFLVVGDAGSVTTWRFRGGACEPLTVAGRPSLFDTVYILPVASSLVMGVLPDARVSLTEIRVLP